MILHTCSQYMYTEIVINLIGFNGLVYETLCVIFYVVSIDMYMYANHMKPEWIFCPTSDQQQCIYVCIALHVPRDMAQRSSEQHHNKLVMHITKIKELRPWFCRRILSLSKCLEDGGPD